MAQHNTDEGNIFLFLYYIRPFGLLALQDGDMKFSMFEINLVWLFSG